MRATNPCCSQKRMISSESLATTTWSSAEHRRTPRYTQASKGTPAISRSILRGRRVEASRAGITAMTFMRPVSHGARRFDTPFHALLDGEPSFVAKVPLEKRLQRGDVEFFACPYRSRLIARCHHTRISCQGRRCVGKDAVDHSQLARSN